MSKTKFSMPSVRELMPLADSPISFNGWTAALLSFAIFAAFVALVLCL